MHKLLLFTLLSWTGLAFAGETSIEWQEMFEGKPVGRASWRWDDTPGAEAWKESMSVAVIQANRRSKLEFENELERVKAGGLRFRRSTALGETRQFDRGRIEDGLLTIESSSLSRWQREVVLGNDALFPFARVGKLSKAGLGETYRSFDFDRLESVPAKLAACAPAKVGCVRIEIADADVPEEWRFGADGGLESVDFEFSHLQLRLQRCQPRCSADLVPIDLLSRWVVPSPQRIAPADSQRKLRFVVSRRDGQLPIMALTGDQDVAVDGGTAFVTVCRNCFKRPAPSAAQLQLSGSATPWFQSTHPLYRRLAARVGGAGEDLSSRMNRSANLVHEKLRPVQTFVGLADAVQTLKIGKADCVGYAVALATLARAQGIPTRMVVGMAYSDRFSGRKDVFSPHAWVQAWDGTRWTSHDAALGDFDSTHIAFAVADDPQELREAFSQLAELRVERVAAVKEIE
jgi:hypothetical protein